MRVVRFKAAHLRLLQGRLQGAQLHMSAEIARPESAHMLEVQCESFSAFDGELLIGCAGLMPMWPGRAVAWALLSEDAGRYMRQIHRATKGFLQQSQWTRIEAFVVKDFYAGQKWMHMLGFECETPEGAMRKYTPDGQDCFLYSLVR